MEKENTVSNVGWKQRKKSISDMGYLWGDGKR